MTNCKACGKEMYFLKAKTGSLVPVNAETISLEDRIALDNNREVMFEPKNKGHISHFADCPRAEKFRKVSK